MKFEIRHQISDLEEEIYLFDVNESIVYTGFVSSKRKNVNEPFGEDWAEYYLETKIKEVNALVEEFGCDIYLEDHPHYYDIQEVYDKYNPTIQGLLSGTYSPNIAKEHPLHKISKEVVISTLIEKVKQMEIR